MKGTIVFSLSYWRRIYRLTMQEHLSWDHSEKSDSPLQSLSFTDTYSLDRNLCELQFSKYCWYPRASNRFLLFPQPPSLCTTSIINCSVSFLLLNCFSQPQPFCIVFQSLFLHLCLPPPICLHFETYASCYMLMSYPSFYPIN